MSSRGSQLMYKPIEFQSFSELVHDFVLNYEKLYHKVTKIKARPRLPFPAPRCRRICAGAGLTPLLFVLAEPTSTVATAKIRNKQG